MKCSSATSTRFLKAVFDAKVIFVISPDPFGNYLTKGLNDIYHGRQLSFTGQLITSVILTIL